VAAAVRDVGIGKFSGSLLRTKVLAGGTADPFDHYEPLVGIARSGKVDRVIAFLLMRGGGRFDHASDHQYPLLRQRINELQQACTIGIHPSYESSQDVNILEEDIARLGKITAGPLKVSRQHFLRWHFPNTLRELIEVGVNEDHTLGFSDRPGFRAGTCTPFPWYDLAREEETTLMLWPFATMDSALHDRMGMGPEDAARTMMAVSDAVRAVKGTYVTVWHDRFLSGHDTWRGWPEALHTVVEHARP